MRDYDPTLARYLSVDPLGTGGGRNRFTYAGANPVNFVDPEGRHPVLGLFFLGLVAWELYDMATGAMDVYDAARDECATKGDVAEAVAWMALGAIDPTPGNVGKKGLKAAKSLGANPFKGKTAHEIADMLTAKGYVPKGSNPVAGEGPFLNLGTGRHVHIDALHAPPKAPHVSVGRPRTHRRLPQREYFLE